MRTNEIKHLISAADEAADAAIRLIRSRPGWSITCTTGELWLCNYLQSARKYLDIARATLLDIERHDADT
jgi:hypothetical protein